MKRIIAGIFIVAFALPMIGWGSTYDTKKDRDGENVQAERGDKQADRDRQENDEDIKRAQGDERGRRNVHDQGSLQDDNRGQW